MLCFSGSKMLYSLKSWSATRHMLMRACIHAHTCMHMHARRLYQHLCWYTELLGHAWSSSFQIYILTCLTADHSVSNNLTVGFACVSSDVCVSIASSQGWLLISSSGIGGCWSAPVFLEDQASANPGCLVNCICMWEASRSTNPARGVIRSHSLVQVRVLQNSSAKLLCLFLSL